MSDTPSDSSLRMTAMSLADMRAYVTSEMNRIKSDISALHEKFNQLKDTQNTDKMALITQLNSEFTRFTGRMNDITLMLQKILGDTEHSGETVDFKFRELTLELENKIMAFRAEVNTSSPNARMQALHESLEGIRTTLSGLATRQALTDMQTNTDNKIKELTAKVGSISGKVRSLSWKIALLIGAIMWVVNTFAGDLVKSLFMAKLAVPTPPVVTPVKDTAKHVKDTVSKAGN